MTAWRMNEWHLIRFSWRHRLLGAGLVMTATLAATVALDLTQAIVAGVALSLLLFLGQVARLEVVPTRVDPACAPPATRCRTRSATPGSATSPAPSSFGAVNQFVDAMVALPPARVIVRSMRGVPMADVSSVDALEHLLDGQRRRGGLLLLTDLQPQVHRLFERAGPLGALGPDRVFWSADQAIVAAGSPAAPIVLAPGLAVADPELDELPRGVVASD